VQFWTSSARKYLVLFGTIGFGRLHCAYAGTSQRYGIERQCKNGRREANQKKSSPSHDF
jgi:hypothetical protein